MGTTKTKLKAEVSPNEAVFNGPFVAPRKVTIGIHNPNEKPIAFKIRSTRKTRFKVRPPTGVVAGGKTSYVDLYCQPFVPASGQYSKKDRFSVYYGAAGRHMTKPSQGDLQKLADSIVLPVIYVPKSNDDEESVLAAKVAPSMIQLRKDEDHQQSSLVVNEQPRSEQTEGDDSNGTPKDTDTPNGRTPRSKEEEDT